MTTIPPVIPYIQQSAVAIYDQKEVRRKTVDERLQDFMQDAKVGERRPLEHFNGERKIEAFRGPGYVNKITEKLTTTPKFELIRNFVEVPHTSPKQFLDNAVILVVDGGRAFAQFFQMEAGKPEKGICVKIFRTDHESVKKFFKSFCDMRKDKYIMTLLSQITGKKLI